MVQRRGGGARPTPRRAAHVTSAFAVFCLATLWCGAVTRAADGPIRLSEAAEQGTFNVGAARASVTREADPRGGGDLLKLDFTIPPGAAAGLYAKSFPGPMDGEHVDLVRMALKAQGTEPVRQVAAATRDQGGRGHPEDPPADSARRDSGRGDARLARDRRPQGSRALREPHGRGRPRDRDDPDRRPLRATLPRPQARHAAVGQGRGGAPRQPAPGDAGGLPPVRDAVVAGWAGPAGAALAGTRAP